jgi:hypothetical protein
MSAACRARLTVCGARMSDTGEAPVRTSHASASTCRPLRGGGVAGKGGKGHVRVGWGGVGWGEALTKRCKQALSNRQPLFEATKQEQALIIH